MIDTTGIKNILFDLGGVVTGLDIKAVLKQFREMGFEELENPEDVLGKYSFFRDYETGRIGTDEFTGSIQRLIGKEAGISNIVHAWNSMILDLPEEHLELLLRLKKKYQIFMLSNTNDLHVRSFNERVRELYGIGGLDEIFEKVYYSHILGMRKPDRKIFEYVLYDSCLNPEETLYIDDTEEHIDSAGQLGIKVYHLRPPELITDLFIE